jgi:HEAT repeat protein
VPALIEVLSTPTEESGPKEKPVGPRLRSEAIRALAKIGPAAAPAVPRLIEMLPQDNSRAEIAQALGAIGAEAKVAVPKLLPLTKDKDLEVRAWSAAALVRLTGKTDEYLPVILTIVRQKPSSNRERWGTSRALTALIWLGPDVTRRAIPELRAALEDDFSWAAMDAAEALGHLGAEAKSAVPELIKLLKNDDARLGKTAVVALGKIGPAAAEALPALRQLAGEEKEGIDQAVAQALEQIQKADK